MVACRAQRGVEEVLPGPLLGDVQTRHIARRAAGNHPLHDGRSWGMRRRGNGKFALYGDPMVYAIVADGPERLTWQEIPDKSPARVRF